MNKNMYKIVSMLLLLSIFASCAFVNTNQDQANDTSSEHLSSYSTAKPASQSESSQQKTAVKSSNFNSTQIDEKYVNMTQKKTNEFTSDDLKLLFTLTEEKLAEIFKLDSQNLYNGASYIQGIQSPLPLVFLTTSICVDYATGDDLPGSIIIYGQPDDISIIENLTYGLTTTMVGKVLGIHKVYDSFYGRTEPKNTICYIKKMV